MKHLTQTTLLFIVFCLASCSQSRVTMNYGKPILVKGESILISEIKGANLRTSVDAYEILKDQLKDDFDQVLFTPHHEYDFIASGLTKTQFDSIGITSNVSKHVAEELKVTYFISMEILNYQESFYRVSDEQQEETNVQVQFKIVDLNNLAVSSGFIVDISTIVYESENYDIDLGTASGLLQKSMKKAAKKILKNAI